MNRLLFFITLLLLLVSLFSFSQTGYLFVKKGFKRKKYTQKEMLYMLNCRMGAFVMETITLLRNDTIFLNGQPVHRTFVKEVLLKRKPKKHLPDAKTMLLIGAGSALTSIGLSLNNKDNKDEALIAGPVIGFGPLLVKHFGGRAIRGIPRKKFRIGKKFHLQVLDFHIPKRTFKSF
ncbi:MAG: hypothetical protein WDO71_08005 [Bacteroidota bacterium]